MNFLLEDCVFMKMTPDVLDRCLPFSCSKDSDINEFFHSEFKDYDTQLLGKSYCFITQDAPQKIVCAFTVSNSSIRLGNIPNSKRNRLNRKIPHPKQRSQYPAVLVGQLAVFDDFSGRKVGDELMDFIKTWFCIENKTGCRYIIVDSINNEKVIQYYKDNGFSFMFESDEEEVRFMRKTTGGNSNDNDDNCQEIYSKTRLMYFDLIVMKSNK